ncbi:MAG: LytTR family DNA-binding domain-containing protein [Firmicutes bacterium]|nr:LytTR family DNA-binding domain-containing protein [Bacillota bacterium]
MRIAICEDEDKYADQLIGYINEWAVAKEIKTEIFAHITAEKFLYEWENNEDYDMIFLDIKMGSMTGMELAEIIRRTNKDVAIVFTTSIKEYAIKGYSVEAMQYLLKPVQKEDCFACLNKVYESDRSRKYFIFNDLDKTFRIPHEDIIYIEKFAHNAKMATAKDEYTFRKTIAQLLGELDNDLFVQCHKSYIINIRHMESMSKTFAIMSTGIKIPLSKNSVKEISERFYNYNVNRV